MADSHPSILIRVEIFEDRATLYRKVALTGGRETLVIDGLSPLLQERFLTLEPQPGLRIEESSVSRYTEIKRHVQDDTTALREAMDTARERYSEAAQSLTACEEELERYEKTRSRINAWLPRVLSEGEGEAWLDDLHAHDDALLEAHAQLTEARLAQEQARREHDLCESRYNASQVAEEVIRNRLTMTIASDRVDSLVFRYTVPCGIWRPSHRATLQDGRVTFEVGAVVWNATGEDWDDVPVTCSTARPGEKAAAPALTDDIVRIVPRKEIAVEVREVAVTKAREAKEVLATGVDDGGEVRTFTVPPGRAFPSDGRPVYLPLTTWSSDARLSWRCTPAQPGVAVLRTVQNNADVRPLLAGPVEVWRSGGRIGRASVDFVGPGEPFSLCWGSHDGIRVARDTETETEESRLTLHQTQRTKVSLRLLHLGDEPVDLEVVERLPVSEVKEVTVPTPVTEPACDVGPDRDGFITWRIPMKPGAERLLTLTYSISAPARVSLPL